MLKLLQYQKKHGHSTSYMSKKYKISRTTLAKWRAMFKEELENTTKMPVNKYRHFFVKVIIRKKRGSR